MEGAVKLSECPQTGSTREVSAPCVALTPARAAYASDYITQPVSKPAKEQRQCLVRLLWTTVGFAPIALQGTIAPVPVAP